MQLHTHADEVDEDKDDDDDDDSADDDNDESMMRTQSLMMIFTGIDTKPHVQAEELKAPFSSREKVRRHF